MCVCVREREREREFYAQIQTFYIQASLSFSISLLKLQYRHARYIDTVKMSQTDRQTDRETHTQNGVGWVVVVEWVGGGGVGAEVSFPICCSSYVHSLSHSFVIKPRIFRNPLVVLIQLQNK